MRLLFPLLLLLAGCASTTTPPAPTPQSHAWATFDDTRILHSEAHGPADRRTGRRLTIDDPVRIASISKLVVALGVMRLVDEGRLDLDRDVSEWLGWRLRNPAFPDAAITLRHLLSHTSGLRDDVGYYAVPLGTELRTLLEQPAAFAAGHPPGAYFTYSNLGFPIVAQVIERATGERFDLLMQRLVLRPLGLDACFNWASCSDGAIARAAVLYDEQGQVARDDLQGQRPACPVVAAADGSCDYARYMIGTNGALFSPQGGLRISVSDLATVGRLLLNRGMHGGSRFLGEASIAEMLRPQWRFDGSNGNIENGFYCAYGLGVQLLAHCLPRDGLFGDSRRRLGHAGEAYRLRSGLWIDPQQQRGIAYFATGLPETPPRGESVYPAVEEWMARRLLVTR
jgi:CubicO group peptidase (beta-lactamase class C family)